MQRLFLLFRCVLVVGAVCGDVPFLLAHGGGLDSNGGHHDRKNGGYHYHRSVSTPDPVAAPTPVVMEEPSPAARKPRTGYRTAVRTTARTDAPTEPRFVATIDRSSLPHTPPPPTPEKKPLLEAQFRVKFVNGTTRDIVSYDVFSDRYMFHMPYGGTIGFPKEVVTQIDPIDSVARAGAS
jgi:hypothetical protein